MDDKVVDSRMADAGGAIRRRRECLGCGHRYTTFERVEEVHPLPADFTGEGPVFMLRVRGESMIEAGILDGDHVVVRQQPTAEKGDVVVAGIPGEEATVKFFSRRGDKIVLRPANSSMSDLVYKPDEVQIFGKVVALLRRF